MAPTSMELRCTAWGCQFVTPDMETMSAMEYLKLQVSTEHTVQAVSQAVSTKPLAEKLTRPVVKKGIGQDQFSYFKDMWSSYKR